MPIFVNQPNQVQTTSPMDRIGQLINLHRLPGESLKSFKLRILDVYIHKANSSYRGCYNGISRELGVGAYTQGIVIDVQRDANGIPTSNTLSVNINSKRIEFITLEGTTELYVDIQNRNQGGYFIHELISTVAAASVPFEIVTWGDDVDWHKSSYLQRLSSRKKARRIPLRNTRLHTYYNLLDVGNWLYDVIFSVGSNIVNEVSDLDFLVGGSYYVNTHRRTIHTFDFPASANVSFTYEAFPLVVPLGDMSIHSFEDSFFIDTVAHQQELTHSTGAVDPWEGLPVTDETPTVRGADYINELLSVAPMYWGE